jgi:hypothetical protein
VVIASSSKLLKKGPAPGGPAGRREPGREGRRPALIASESNMMK